MFDASKRLIICNKQYADTYGLSEELTKPGTPFPGNPGTHRHQGNAPERLHGIPQGLGSMTSPSIAPPYQTINRLRDGRYIAVVHRPLANGGWVATYEDVTEAKRREEFSVCFRRKPRSNVGHRQGDPALPCGERGRDCAVRLGAASNSCR